MRKRREEKARLSSKPTQNGRAAASGSGESRSGPGSAQAGDADDTGDAAEDGDDEDDVGETKLSAVERAKLAARRRRMGANGTEERKSSGSRRGPKKPTVWHGTSTKKLSKKEAEKLDMSRDKMDGDEDVDEAMRKQYLPEEGEAPAWEDEEEDIHILEEDDDDVDADGNGSGDGSDRTSGTWGLTSLFQSLTSGRSLSEEDLEGVMDGMKDVLVSKNVAIEIAEDLCAAVAQSLVGQRVSNFQRVKSLVQPALEQAIVNVLTPSENADVLRQVLQAKRSGKVFTMVFVGINGVGKSTSLAKVAYFLKSHGCRPLIAACDTFRSGAVEQLRTHARCLQVDLFERGYSRDPSSVASAAKAHARENKYDVLLVDTAGRMQNNEPLMKALSQLISDNTPELTVFVGEALVGNDGIDQLMMFNQALANNAPPGTFQQVDGIILTKFDTIDDKVGAALSMSYKTSKPILFVGTGQKYTHLKHLSVPAVINSLFA